MERHVWGMKWYHRVGSLRGLVEAQLSRTVPIWNISLPATLPTLPSYRNIQKISQYGYQCTFRLDNKNTTVMRTKSFHGMCFLNTASQATLQALRPIERCYHQKSNLPGVAGDADPHFHILYSHSTMSIYLIIYHSQCPSKSLSLYLDSILQPLHLPLHILSCAHAIAKQKGPMTVPVLTGCPGTTGSAFTSIGTLEGTYQ